MSSRAGVGIGVLVRRSDEILLIKRTGSHGEGTWSCPGGHIEFGESFEECAARECMEETGVSIKNIRFKTLTNDVFQQEGKHYVTVWMEADYASGPPRVASSLELTEVQWFKWEDLPTPLFLPLENLLQGHNIGRR